MYREHTGTLCKDVGFKMRQLHYCKLHTYICKTSCGSLTICLLHKLVHRWPHRSNSKFTWNKGGGTSVPHLASAVSPTTRLTHRYHPQAALVTHMAHTCMTICRPSTKRLRMRSNTDTKIQMKSNVTFSYNPWTGWPKSLPPCCSSLSTKSGAPKTERGYHFFTTLAQH